MKKCLNMRTVCSFVLVRRTALLWAGWALSLTHCRGFGLLLCSLMPLGINPPSLRRVVWVGQPEWGSRTSRGPALPHRLPHPQACRVLPPPPPPRCCMAMATLAPTGCTSGHSSRGLGSRGPANMLHGRSRGRAVMTTSDMKTHFAVITDLLGPTLCTF